MFNRILSILVSLFIAFLCFSQEEHTEGNVIDQVVAVVGGHIILHSDVEVQYLQYRMQQGASGSESTVKCGILENMLFQKLLLNQAEIDSVVVTETQIEAELDRRLRYFISQFGSQEKFEEFYEKSVVEFKEEFRGQVEEQMLVENVQRGITENVQITPSEVKDFYREIPPDSLPLINSEVEIAQIVKMPPVSPEEEERVREQLRKFRERIRNGESFATLAILYSEDTESAKRGGEVGLVGRGELFPEFEAVAFNLEKGEVSEIVKTDAGYHIMQLIERRGDYVNVRHILLTPKVSPTELVRVKEELDSIAGLIDKGEYNFEEAVEEFSDDPGKNNRGLVINPMTGTSMFEIDQLDPKVFFVIDKLEVGDISNPVIFTNEEGKQGYRILQLRKRTNPHRANLKEDYNRIQNWALEKKKSEMISDWISEKVESTYVRINDEYMDCTFANKWIDY